MRIQILPKHEKGTQEMNKLLTAKKNDNVNIKKLGESLMLESNTLTPLLKKLELKKYIKRTKNKDDERNIIITLTDLGKSLKDDALEVPKQMVPLDAHGTSFLRSLKMTLQLNMKTQVQNGTRFCRTTSE